MKKRILSAILAAVFFSMTASLSHAAFASGARAVPEGYNENDYLKLLAFMETEDSSGVKNGQKIVACFGGYYDPDDPMTWSYYYYDHDNGILYMWGVFWSDEPDSRVTALELVGMGLAGSIDASGCSELYEAYCDGNHFDYMSLAGCAQLRALTCRGCGMFELDVSGCTGLELMDVSGNSFEELDVSGCTALYDIECNDSQIEYLDVSGCAELAWLNCSGNDLTELDVTGSPALSFLCCGGNPLRELDLSNNPGLPFDRVTALGEGYVGFDNYGHIDDEGYWVNMNAALAEPAGDEAFLGWYSAAGELISVLPELDADSTSETVVFARFGCSLPGDANGDGEVNVADALMALRFSMGLLALSPSQEASADVNGDGAVTVQDALLILRFSMGLVGSF